LSACTVQRSLTAPTDRHAGDFQKHAAQSPPKTAGWGARLGGHNTAKGPERIFPQNKHEFHKHCACTFFQARSRVPRIIPLCDLFCTSQQPDTRITTPPTTNHNAQRRSFSFNGWPSSTPSLHEVCSSAASLEASQNERAKAVLAQLTCVNRAVRSENPIPSSLVLRPVSARGEIDRHGWPDRGRSPGRPASRVCARRLDLDSLRATPEDCACGERVGLSSEERNGRGTG